MVRAVALYRVLTGAAGLAAPAIARLGRKGGAWRESLTGASEETSRAAGSVWIHAASMGEVGAARNWARALVESGVRPPLLVTTRTTAGLARARRDLSDVAASRFAPADLPQLLRAFLDHAAPFRIDVIETEIWPNLLDEAGRAGLAVVFVSGTVSARTAGRLRALGVSGERYFGRLVHALPRSEADADRFRLLGISSDRIRVVGDLKADDAGAEAAPAVSRHARRRVVVFGSLRPGEEAAARAVAEALAALPDRPVLVIAPRHEEGLLSAKRALAEAGFSISERAEGDRTGSPIAQWMDALAARGGTRAGLLATKGELPDVYARAEIAIIGGTFAPFGGHNALEAAARGCPVIVGPHHGEIAASVGTLLEEGGGAIARNEAEAAALAAAWMADSKFAERSTAALRGAAGAGGAARRAIAALTAWGLSP